MGEGSAVTAGKGESRTFEWIWRDFTLPSAKTMTGNCKHFRFNSYRKKILTAKNAFLRTMGRIFKKKMYTGR